MFIKPIFMSYDYSSLIQDNNNIKEKHSCIEHQQSDNPELYERIGGMPESYVIENTTIYQFWIDEEKTIQKLGNLVGIDPVSVSTIRQPCGSSIPMHVDHFHKIRIKYPNDKRTRVRANIFLEDWAPGHHLQYKVNDEWKVCSHWKAGEGFIWDSEVFHLSGNSGMLPKHTLQISGFLI